MNVLITVQIIWVDEEGCDGYLHSLIYGKSNSYSSGTNLLRSSAGCGRSENSTGTVSKVPYPAYPGYIPGGYHTAVRVGIVGMTFENT